MIGFTIVRFAYTAMENMRVGGWIQLFAATDAQKHLEENGKLKTN